MTRQLFYFLLLFLVVSCSPKLHISNIEKIESNDVLVCKNIVFGPTELLPDSSVIIADFKTKGAFFISKKYGFNESLNLVSQNSPINTFNAIKIDTIISPKFLRNSSYDLKGRLLRIKECPEEQSKVVNEPINGRNHYVKLFRKNRIFGESLSFLVSFNGHLLSGLDNNSKIIIEIQPLGNENFLQIESYGEKLVVPIDFTNNKIVYVECKVDGYGRPEIMIENEYKGEMEFKEIKNVP